MKGAQQDAFSKGYRTWLIVLLLAINTFNFADRSVMSALAEAVKRDLAISDLQLGLLQGFGFALFYSILGLPIARLAERRSRAAIIARRCSARLPASCNCCCAGSAWVWARQDSTRRSLRWRGISGPPENAHRSWR